MARQTDTVSETQTQFLDTVRQSQEAVVRAVQTWSESLSRLVPDVSTLPFGDQYFNPTQAVDTAFDFAQQLLDTQREFAHRVLSATAPAVEASQEKATPSTTKSGSKS